MASQAERTSLPGPARVTDDRDAFADMFDAHARHIFDYCCSLLGDRVRAASATQVTLIAAHSLADRLKDTRRRRAFVLALGRWECLSGGQGLAGAAEGDAVGPAGTEDLAAALALADQADDGIGDPATGELTLSDFEVSNGLSLRAILEALPRQDREILDLHYRHEVGMADLAPLLGVSAASVPGMLAAAKAKFAARTLDKAGLAAGGLASPDVRVEQLSAVRLVSLPASVWRRTARVVMDPRFSAYREAVSAHAEHLGPDGFPVQAAPTPSSRKLLMASALMAGLLLAPAAAGGAVYAAVSTLAHVVDHPHSTAVTPGPTSGGSAAGGASGGRAHSAGGAKRAGSKGKANLGAGVTTQPSGSGSRHRHHKPSPPPTSRYSSPTSPGPSQTPTSTGSPSPSTSPSPSPTSTSAAAGAAATPPAAPSTTAPSSTPSSGTSPVV